MHGGLGDPACASATRRRLLDLVAARSRTFVLGTLTAGFLGRIAINATPFLLPLMFQIGFHDTAFAAGLMVLVYMAGNLSMKAATTQTLRRFGFRSVLVVNGLPARRWRSPPAACSSPQWSLAGDLRGAGHGGHDAGRCSSPPSTRSASPTSRADARSGATTMSAMAQQVGSALGVAFATLGLALAQSVDAASAGLALKDFQVAFFACGALMAALVRSGWPACRATRASAALADA